MDAWLADLGLGDKPLEVRAHGRLVLQTLRQLVDRSVEKLLISVGLTPELARRGRVQLRTFGSYRLGVDAAAVDSDIDVVVLGGQFVERSLFFTTLEKALGGDSRVQSVKVSFLIKYAALAASRPSFAASASASASAVS
jgi:poly(A) polymerase Pap1